MPADTWQVELMKKLRHRNLVEFYGACVRQPKLVIVTQLMDGSLQQLFRAPCAPPPPPPPPPPPESPHDTWRPPRIVLQTARRRSAPTGAGAT